MIQTIVKFIRLISKRPYVFFAGGVFLAFAFLGYFYLGGQKKQSLPQKRPPIKVMAPEVSPSSPIPTPPRSEDYRLDFEKDLTEFDRWLKTAMFTGQLTELKETFKHEEDSCVYQNEEGTKKYLYKGTNAKYESGYFIAHQEDKVLKLKSQPFNYESPELKTYGVEGLILNTSEKDKGHLEMVCVKIDEDTKNKTMKHRCYMRGVLKGKKMSLGRFICTCKSLYQTPTL